MNEELSKSKQIEQTIIAEAGQMRTKDPLQRDAFRPLDEHETQTQLSKLNMSVMIYQERNGEAVEYHKTPERETADRVHAKVEDEYANLSWSQKRKLASRQKKNLETANKQGVEGATGLTIPMMEAYERAKQEANDVISPEVINQEPQNHVLLKMPPDTTLFDKRYKEKNDIPYEIDRMAVRMAQLNAISREYETYLTGIANGQVPRKLDYEAECAAQMEIKTKLNRALEALLRANAVNSGEPSPFDEEELAKDRNELLRSCITDYERAAENYDKLLDRHRSRIFHECAEGGLGDIPVNDEEVREYGFSFRERPAMLDEIKAQMDDPANAEYIEKNAPTIASVWKQLIRITRTIDQLGAKRSHVENIDAGSMTKEKNAMNEHIAGLGLTAETYEKILKHFISGQELDERDALILHSDFGVYSEQWYQFETKNPDYDIKPKTKQISEVINNRTRRVNSSSAKFFNSLPYEQVNPELDVRVIAGLCKGWETGADGKPLTREDADIMENETKWIRDIFGNDVTARNARLDEYLDEYINTVYETDYIRTSSILGDPLGALHTAQVGLLLDNFSVAFPDYFDSLSPEMKGKLMFASKRNTLLTSYIVTSLSVNGGVEQSGALVDKTYTESVAPLLEHFREQLLPYLKNYGEGVRAAGFDAVTDEYSLEEYPTIDKAINVMTTPRFVEKLNKRREKNLPCTELSQVFKSMDGKTMGMILDEVMSFDFDEAEIETIKRNGFGGASVSFSFDFGTDDMAQIGDIINLIADGGEKALEYGANEQVAQELKASYADFQREVVENSRIKRRVELISPFDMGLGVGEAKLKKVANEFPELAGEVTQYAQRARSLMSQLYKDTLASDKRLSVEHLQKVVGVFARNNISFIKEHREPLIEYMNDETKQPEITTRASVNIGGEQLDLYGDMAEQTLEQSRLEAKQAQLGDGFGAWLQTLKTLTAEANEAYISMRKCNAPAAEYFAKTGEISRLYTSLGKAKGDRDKAAEGTPERQEAIDRIESLDKTIREKEPAIKDVPVFGKIERHKNFMQFELLQKEVYFQNTYEKKIQQIKDHFSA